MTTIKELEKRFKESQGSNKANHTTLNDKIDQLIVNIDRMGTILSTSTKTLRLDMLTIKLLKSCTPQNCST